MTDTRTSAIRMIACDIDGTLLQEGQTALPAGFDELLSQLEARGILFCVASGRQFANLRELFGPLADRICYVCENGALVFGPDDHTQPLYKSTLPWSLIRAIAESVLELPGCDLLLSGLDTSYPILKDPDLLPMMRYYCGSRVIPVDHPDKVQDEIIQISTYCRPNTEMAYEALSRRWGKEVNVVVAGEHWIDFPAANKGSALQALCEKLGILPGEVIAFGDNFNDVSMLDLVGFPVLMENAPDLLKARYACRSLDVSDSLRRWLDTGTL